MKKLILLIILKMGSAAGVLAQGTVIFESSSTTGTIFVGDPASAGTYQVALLWAVGTTPVAQGSLTQAVVFTGNGNGYFTDPTTITLAADPAGAAAIFEVQGWTGNYANYAAAIAGGAIVSESAEFVNNVGNPTTTPPGTPVQTTGWNGNLIIIPEPSTIALGGLGAAALLLFRRRK